MNKQKRLTDASVRALKPKARQYQKYEGGGFGVRVMPSGKVSFVYRFTSPLLRERRLTVLGNYPAMSLTEARKAHAAAFEAVQKGKDPAVEKIEADKAMREVKTVAQLVDAFIEARPRNRKGHRAKPETFKEYDRLLRADLVPVLGRYRITDLTKARLNRVLDRPEERGAPYAENRLRAAISRMLNWAVDQDYLRAVPAMREPNKEHERDRRVEGESLKDFWQYIDGVKASPSIKIALRLLLATGQRRSEVAAMKSADIKGELWTIPETKNGKAHKVPLSRLALDLIRQAKALNGKSDYLFPSPKGEGPIHPDALTRAMVRGKLGVSPHDLRRTVATEMVALGIAPHVVGEVLNHTRQGVTMKHYLRHDFAAEKRDALNRWAAELERLVPGLALPGNVTPIRA